MLNIPLVIGIIVRSCWLHDVSVPERLRGLTRNQLGSACAGSSPAADVLRPRGFGSWEAVLPLTFCARAVLPLGRPSCR